MKIGTRSVLYGAHCFFIHPWFVALAWWKLYGFRPVEDPYVGEVSLWNWRLWLAFFVHDLGYWGMPNMDGEEGEMHPYWAGYRMAGWTGSNDWSRFCIYHSRFLAKQRGKPYSMLCVADKLAVALEPAWLYLPRVILTGEIKEYMSLAAARDPEQKTAVPESKYDGEPPTKYESMGLDLSTRRAWHRNMTEYLVSWAYEHQDGRQDKWTPDVRVARDETGVWN